VVKGLDVFQNHFARYEDQYVLIGGTAELLPWNLLDQLQQPAQVTHALAA
jgi:hypothetical protein